MWQESVSTNWALSRKGLFGDSIVVLGQWAGAKRKDRPKASIYESKYPRSQVSGRRSRLPRECGYVQKRECQNYA
jgi:hypothetical protein